MANANTQIQTVDINKIQAIGEFGVPELMAMKESIAKKLSIPQFNLFMYQMNRMGLDPSLGHGVPILYGTDVNIRIEYEGLKSLAQKSEGFKGIFSQAICENDDFEAESDEDGLISRITFKMNKPPRGKVVGSFAVAKRDGFKDFIVVCDMTEFEKYMKKNPSFWKLENGSIDPDMAKKFAATRAVKGQFNIAVVVEENMLALATADGIPAYTPPAGPRDITQEVDAAMNGGSGERAPEPSEPTEADKIAAARKELSAKLSELGHTTREAKGEYLANNVKFKNAEKPTLAELTKAIKTIEMQIEDKQATQAAEDDALLNLVE